MKMPRRVGVARWLVFSLLFGNAAHACDMPDDIFGTWYVGGYIVIEDDFTGVIWGQCSAQETLTASPLTQGFHLNVQWNHIFGCSAATADVYFASPTDCDTAIGTYTNTPNGTPTAITLERLPVNAYFSDQPYGSTIPADAVVDRHPVSPSGTHNSRILTRIQLDVLLLEHISGIWQPLHTVKWSSSHRDRTRTRLHSPAS